MTKRFLSVLVAVATSTLLFGEVADSLALQEVVVTGTRNATDIRHLPMTVTVIERETLTEQNYTNVLPTVVQQVPGLMVTARGMMGYGVSTGAAGGINLRGVSGGAGQLLVLIDGHPQYQSIFGHPISDSYQTLMTDRVEVLRGPASVLYGSNAMGGVMNIVTRSMHGDGVKTSVNVGAGSYGTVQAEASNQTRFGKFSSTVAAQYGRTDNHRPNMGFEQYGGYLKLGYDFSDHWNAYADVNITHFNASNPGTVQQPKIENDQWITRGVVSAAVENHYDRTSGAVSFYSNFGRHKINDGYNEGKSPMTDFFRSKDAVTGVSLYQSTQLFEGNRVTIGFDYQHIYGHAYYTNRETGEVVTTKQRLMQSADEKENEFAGYVDFRQDLTEWLTIDAGLRYDHHSTAGSEWVPQAGVVVRPVSSGEIKAMVSKGFRNPTMKEMYLYGMANHDSLHAERLWNYELSWRHRVGTLSYGVNFFYMKGDHMILPTQVVGGKKNLNTGNIKNYGAEFEASYQVNEHLTLHTNHSLLKMKERDVAAAPKYKGFLSASYRLCKWNFMAGVQYFSGLGLDTDNDGFADETNKDFCLLSANVRYILVKNLSLWVRGENLLVQRYEINYGYPMPRATFMGGINFAF